MTSKPTKVALVMSRWARGGKEKFVYELATQLSRERFQPIIVTLERCDRAAFPLERSDIEVFCLDKARGNDLRVVLRLARLLREQGVDIIHSNNWGTLVECIAAAKLAGGRPVVHTQHGLDFGFEETGRLRSFLRLLVKRSVARWVSRFIAVSGEVCEVVRREWRVSGSKVQVITNGVAPMAVGVDGREREEVRRELEIEPDSLLIGAVGWFRPVKDYPCLVEAMEQVARCLPQARLVIVGDGPLRGAIEAAIERHGVRARVKVLGARRDVARILSALDLFALSSISEGISLSILEAMSLKLPVVATRVGGNPEVVEDGVTGLLVAPRDPKEMARAMVEILSDAPRRRLMGERGHARYQERFSLGRMAAEYEELYRSVVAAP
ncbi:MAG: glycosyltransferase [Thermoanaerobaculia bacterium]